LRIIVAPFATLLIFIKGSLLIKRMFTRSTWTTIAALVLILIAGLITFRDIPKESDPDVKIPIIYVALTLDGISPEDAERLLVRPFETQLRSIEGIKEMRSIYKKRRDALVESFAAAGWDIPAPEATMFA